MNNRITAVRRLQFCAGHRVHLHESKCRNLHGHNYVAFFHAESKTGLDALGRVIDFGVLKTKLGPWIDEHWDHGMVLWKHDAEALAIVRQIQGQKVFELPENPTAENMALHLLHVVCPELFKGTGVEIVRVVLWETENCYTEVAVEHVSSTMTAVTAQGVHEHH